MKTQAPFGSWQSPITAAMVAGKTPKIFDTLINHKRLFWSESIAAEKGRTGIMMHDGKQHQCILPRPLSAKSKVHEYGGGAFTVEENKVYFVLDDDQRIYSRDFSQSAFIPVALTPTGNFRFADLQVDKKNHAIIAVCEEHHADDKHRVDNFLISVPMNGNQQITTLTRGHDFYSNPQISPAGDKLMWLSWDHPDMPWDNTQLWLADLSAEGIDNIRKIAGNGNESIFQPQWSPLGDIVFVSDKNNWWNLFSLNKNSLDQNSIDQTEIGQAEPKASCIYSLEAEFATPQWVFGMSTYGFLDDYTIFATYTQNGIWKLIKIHLDKINTAAGTAHIEEVKTALSDFEYLSAGSGIAACVGSSSSQVKTLLLYKDENFEAVTTSPALVDSEEYSQPQPIEFDTTDNQSARALYYPPQNTHYDNNNSLPPLIVICHGGPTGASESSLNLKIQYWTNRGFAVADVNYRGSTGYGREFRHRLFNKWGVYDVDDVCAVVSYLSAQNLIDKDKCIIKGSSAGGYTVLAALAFKDTFRAGVSLYGIGDLEMLANDTHKFEARYLDKLIGPYPEQAAIYRQRSPIHYVEKINCPLLVFQGLLDKVVPPNQAESLVNSVKSKGLPVAYVTYANEAHGFRQCETIEHMLDSELQFYSRVFNFAIETPQHPLAIENI